MFKSNVYSHLHPRISCHLSPAELIDCVQPHPLNNEVLHHVVDEDDRDGQQSEKRTTVGDDLKVPIKVATISKFKVQMPIVLCTT